MKERYGGAYSDGKGCALFNGTISLNVMGSVITEKMKTCRICSRLIKALCLYMNTNAQAV